MGKCAKCGAAAHLYENGTPRCFKCSETIEAARSLTLPLMPGTQTRRHTNKNGGPYVPPRASLVLCVFEVEAIEIHHLDPGVREVPHEALLPIGFGVNFSNRAQLRVRAKDQIHRGRGPLHGALPS
jgi:hypothetical protein